ncbi:MAG: hypothetical protein IJS45_09040 [Clostridia bacterium]|nr:hypothetical protein [Clostridia bacterium]
MKRFIKFIAIAVVLTLALAALASCGGNAGNDTANDTGKDTEADNGNTLAGEVKTSGNITVFVPEEFDFSGTNLFNEEDENAARLINKEDGSNYVLISLYDKASAESSLDMTREINEGSEDITVVYGGNTWAGVRYDSFGYDVFQVYCEANRALVTCCGYTIDSDVAAAVLGSIK